MKLVLSIERYKPIGSNCSMNNNNVRPNKKILDAIDKVLSALSSYSVLYLYNSVRYS